MVTTTQDPFDTATKAEPLKPIFYAQIQCDAWFCVLVKGEGKVVFDAAKHPIEQRRTAISLSLAPIAEQQVQFPLIRQMIAESKEWAGIVWSSAKQLGIKSAKELNGKWAKVEIVPAGGNYTNKQGETKDRTTFKILAIYPDEAACRASYHSAGAPPVDPEAANGHTAAAPATNGNPKEREAALAFLKVLVPQWCAKGLDPDAVARGIAANPVIARHFTIESEEVVNLMMAHAK
jgi:hypothetical protein